MQKGRDWEGVKTVEKPPPAALPTPEVLFCALRFLALHRQGGRTGDGGILSRLIRVVRAGNPREAG